MPTTIGMRLLAFVAVLTLAPGVIAGRALPSDKAAPIDARVHDRGICWDPDVEFPVPCDDDD